MVKSVETNLVELEFRRDENKFFVPPTFSDQAVSTIETVSNSLGLEKEQHKYPITRSAYYYLGDTDSMPPGFSVRYREYVDRPISEGGGSRRKSRRIL